MDESPVLINHINIPPQIYYGHFVLQCISTYFPFNIKTASTVHHSLLTGLLFTFCEGRGLGHVRQAELALLPAAVVADQGVVGLLDVHIIADAEHVTGSLDV